MKHREKYILYKIWNISKNKAPIDKRGYCFWEKVCMYNYQKIAIGSIVSELNP